MTSVGVYFGTSCRLYLSSVGGYYGPICRLYLLSVGGYFGTSCRLYLTSVGGYFGISCRQYLSSVGGYFVECRLSLTSVSSNHVIEIIAALSRRLQSTRSFISLIEPFKRPYVLM